MFDKRVKSGLHQLANHWVTSPSSLQTARGSPGTKIHFKFNHDISKEIHHTNVNRSVRVQAFVPKIHSNLFK